MKHMNKTLRRSCLSLTLCLVLFASLFAAPAFAAGTLVIIGGPVENNAVVEPSSSAVVISGSGNSAPSGIVSDTPAAQVIIGSKVASGAQAGSAQAYVVQDGSVVSVGQQQAVQNSAPAEAADALPVAAPAAAEPTGIAAELIAKVNQVRAENGVGAVKYSAALQSIADTRVKESVVSFGHTRPDGSHCSTAVTVDYQITGENLIQGPSEKLTTDLMMETWMNSPTHRYNILLSQFTDMAVGTYVEKGVTYVSMLFIG